MDQSVLKEDWNVLTTDPGMGVARHVDAGYDIAIQTAKEKGIHIPMIDKAGDK